MQPGTSRAEGGLMRSSLKLLALGAVLAIGAAHSTGALAVDKEQVIKDRQALMKEQATDLGAVKGYLDDKADLAKATAAATDLTHTMGKIPDVFPPGTEGPNPEDKFAPKPEVWSDWKGFLADRDTAAGKAEALLAAVKGGDKAAIQTAFADLGKNGCGACHGKFREEIKK
jgi:cytochrome c556